LRLKGRIISDPKKKYEVRIAETEASNKGRSEARVRSRLNTSIAKMIAAIGALKMLDMAPAAAQPISRVRVAWFMLKALEIFDPREAPVATVGPSNPTDPPNPTVMGAVRSEAYICMGFISPFFLEIAYKVEGMPCPMGCLIPYLTISRVSASPTIGKMK